MATNFPTSLDTFPSAATLAGHQLSTDPHSTLHGNLGDCVAAAEAKIGIDGSAVTTSLDYIVNRLLPAPSQGRLTLTTAVPVTTADVTGAATVYFTPYNGDGISLYNTSTSKWQRYSFAEISASLSGLTLDIPTDVFAYWSGTAVTLELVNWTNGTTRATALALQDGIQTKSGDASRLLLGTLCGSGAGTCEDSLAKRFVANIYNKVHKGMKVLESTNNWSYTGNYRSMNGSTANRLQIVSPLATSLLDMFVAGYSTSDTAQSRLSTIGVDVTNSPSYNVLVQGYNATFEPSFAYLRTFPPIGYHFYQALEYALLGTNTWYGFGYFGIVGVYEC